MAHLPPSSPFYWVPLLVIFCLIDLPQMLKIGWQLKCQSWTLLATKGYHLTQGMPQKTRQEYEPDSSVTLYSSCTLDLINGFSRVLNYMCPLILYILCVHQMTKTARVHYNICLGLRITKAEERKILMIPGKMGHLEHRAGVLPDS